MLSFLPSSRHPIFLLAFDIEAVSHTDWVSVGLCLVTYPALKLVKSQTWSVKRNLEDYKTTNRDWWRKHPEAWRAIQELAKDKTITEVEKEIAVYVNNIMTAFPKAYIISDNPSFDLFWINKFLIDHSFPTLNERKNNKYLFPICLWSFTQGLKCNCAIQKIEFCPEKPKRGIGRGKIEIAHHPLGDCKRMLLKYAGILDWLQKVHQ